MTSKRCFEQGCENEILYVCLCSSPEAYSCGSHLGKHCQLLRRNHYTCSVFYKPCVQTKNAILDVLFKAKSKKEKLKKMILDSCKNLKGSENTLKEILEKLNSDLSQIHSSIEKISQAQKVSKLEEDSVLKLLALQPEYAAKSAKEMIRSQINSTLDDLNKKINEIIPQDWESKKLAILNKTNDPEGEQEFRATCWLYEKQCSALNQPLSRDYQEYVNNYHQVTSLYITWEEGYATILHIYDTESESKKEIRLRPPKELDWGTCNTRLPNGEVFCYGNWKCSGIALIIDRNYGIRVLPSGTACCFSSAIYFNNNVYCFGGNNRGGHLALSNKFDLNENRWINLTPMPKANSSCHSVIFNGNILICRNWDKNLLLYSIDIDSFSIIPYEFGEYNTKILINVERLYLIECYDGLIYKSEDEYHWEKIAKSIISFNPGQVCYLYNKGGIYIIANLSYYYKFDLNQKVMIKFN